MCQGLEGSRSEDRASSAMAGAADREKWARVARQYVAADYRASARVLRRLDPGSDRTRRLSAKRSDLGDAAVAQALSALREHQAGEVLSQYQVDSQGRRHRVPEGGERGHDVEQRGHRGRR